MTRPHARAGAPYVPPMPIDFAGDEPTNSTLEQDYERTHAPVEQKELVSLRDSFLKIFKKVLP